MCMYYCKLNSITIHKLFPQPRMEDLVDQLHGAKIFTRLDLRSRFHQVRIKEVTNSKLPSEPNLGISHVE